MMEEKKAEMAEYEAEKPNLTDPDDLRANKRASKMAEADYNFAKERSEELLILYDRMLEEKAAREEEYKFQEQIDAQYDIMNEKWPALDQWHTNMNTLWIEMDMMYNNGADESEIARQQKKIDYAQKQIDTLNEEI